MRRHNPQRRALVLALLAVVGVVAATFSRALLGDGVFFQRDILSYWYPGMAVFRRAVGEGSWPLWNPNTGFGAPLLADASFQLAYPPTWLVLGVPLRVYYTAFVVGHCLWAALGSLALCRRIGLGWAASAAGGVAFALSGPFVSAASLFHHYAGAAWMPWVLAALESLLRRPRVASAAALGLTAGGQLLAGSGDLCLATGILGLARLTWYVWHSRRRARPATTPRLAGMLLLAAGLALGLGSLQWLPTAAQASRGSRTAQGEASAYWSLHPLSLLDLAFPRLVADAPFEGEARQRLFEGREPLLAGLYLGVATLGLGALGMGLGSRGARLTAAGATFFLVASLGHFTPLYRALESLPGFGLMRYPQKYLLAASLCVALLCALGVGEWLRPWEARGRARARSLAGGLVVLAALAMVLALALAAGVLQEHLPIHDFPRDAGSDAAAALRVVRTALLFGVVAVLLTWRSGTARPPFPATAALLLLGAVDLSLVGRELNPLAPPELVEHRPPLADALAPEAATGRVQFVRREPACARVEGGPAGWEYPWRAALASVDVIRPPSGGRWGLYGAYDGEFTGLEPRWLTAPMAAAVHLAGTPPGTRLLQMGNVERVLWLGRTKPATLQLLSVWKTPCACPMQLLRVPEPLPRAYVVRAEKSLPSGAGELEALLSPGFDPHREVLLADGRPGLYPAVAYRPARVLAQSSDAVEVQVDRGEGGVLVLVEAFDPGWQATVDGKRVPVLRANALFRGVRLSPGAHRVRFSYRPWSVAVGSCLFLASLAAAALLSVAGLTASPLNRALCDASIEERAGGSQE